VVRAGRFEFTAGPRVEYMRWGDNSHVTFDPRAVARYRVIDPVTVIASTGLFNQPPPVFALVPQAGNPNLLPQLAWQTSLGAEATLPLHFDVRLTGFYNRMWQLPRATYEFVNGPNGPERALAVSDGQGQAYGLEVQIRRQLASGIYGWLSYTLSRSERWLEDPVTHQVVGRVVPFTYDQTHVLNLAVSWDIDHHWRVGARFQLATGSPTSLVTGAIYDADSDRYRPQYMSEADRLPTYHQLDVRVDYKFRLGPFDMAAYLDVLNIYNAQNSEGWIYQYDYTVRAPRPGLPILPALGIRGEL
jgi:outer membrane receptor protein involved in Fe transport